MTDLNEKLTSEFVMLRPKLTDGNLLFDGDIDFVVSENGFRKFLSIVHYNCKISGVHFELNQKPLNKKVLTLFRENKGDQIILEIWSNIEITGKYKTIITANDIFSSHLFKNSKTAVLALIYITHLYHKSKDKNSDENLFRFNWFTKNISRSNSFEEKTVDLLNQVFNEGLSLSEANKKAIELLKSEEIVPVLFPVNLIREWSIRIIKKLKLRTNKVIPVIGPDGVGKGTLQENALNKINGEFALFPFKLLYRVIYLYRLRLTFVKNWRLRANNEMDENFCNYIFWTAFFTMPFLILFKRPKRVLLDRYFVDYFASPIRYYDEGNLPQLISFYHYYLFLTPTPDLLVLLGCRDSSLIERKNELGIEAIRKLEEVYFDFIARKRIPTTLFISTEQDAVTTSEILYRKLSSINNRRNKNVKAKNKE